ncbi:MAG: 50S ribosomal protein L23 [Rhabdochlamydiaceae bacterium]|nr:50S ribosomal protein L23 [Candidatus Amphrikana amoebophyrae]
MTRKSPYSVIKSRYMTEKVNVLQNLHAAEGNKSLSRCNKPKYVFLVAKDANKTEIRLAIEEIYREKGVKVTSVNTINIKPKPRRVRGRKGKTAMKRKAVVTFSAGDVLDEQV